MGMSGAVSTLPPSPGEAGAVAYELYYWPQIQGRGEFVRLALEEAGENYLDVARLPGKDGGLPAMMKLMGGGGAQAPFAPPFLRRSRLVISQTANILCYLGARHALAPANERGRLWTNQLQLTIADLVGEAHDTHHPIAARLYFEDQRDEAKRRAADFVKYRMPKYLRYFEDVLADGAGRYLVGRRLTYADLSLFQVVEGLRYAFPRAAARLEKKTPRVVALHDAVAARPRIKAYLASERRIPFNEKGIFRRYAELDG